MMIKGFIQADLRNPVVHKYLEHSVRSFERVKDVFNIEIVQCLLPGDDVNDSNFESLVRYHGSFDESKGRSPQEKASLLSQYRMMKRISEGEQLFVMEHDAYLKPEGEEEFRRVLGKFHQLHVCNVGIAMECYTAQPKVAAHFCHLMETDGQHNHRGPMTFLHVAGDLISKQSGTTGRFCWWPKKGMKGETGLAHNVTTAFTKPHLTIPAPVCQLIDLNYGSTVKDRTGIKAKYTRKSHPNFHFIDI